MLSNDDKTKKATATKKKNKVSNPNSRNVSKMQGGQSPVRSQLSSMDANEAKVHI